MPPPKSPVYVQVKMSLVKRYSLFAQLQGRQRPRRTKILGVNDYSLLNLHARSVYASLVIPLQFGDEASAPRITTLHTLGSL